MVSKISAYRFAYRPGLESKGSLLEGFHHLSTLEKTEVPPLQGRNRIMGELARQRGEILPCLNPLQRSLGLGSYPGFFLNLHLLSKFKKDVARPHLFLLAKLFFMYFV